MDYGLEGKTALITGGASGIGKATAQALLDEGAQVILVDVQGDAVARAARDLGRGARALQADLRDPAQIKGLAATTEERFTLPDILVCAAGVTGAKGHPLELSDADWHEAWETDFMSVVRTVRAFEPQMEKRGWGRVVILCSENAVQPYADEAVYNVAKAGLLTFAKGLSGLAARRGVLVNCVSPAFIETPMTDGMMDKKAKAEGTDRGGAIAEFLKTERPWLALDRRGTAQEAAAAIAFLCSEQASFVVGANYRVDGGSVAAIAL
ncbi:SDR family NAD(P)-dependent oxidoreductase [Poseidonocella sedimentorum]|uniref:NAD(P)-dependent dehydrogenase, short-chain alcohol dehydrogenase family n=1 Tax=Poseidonocella sedimentorum TaxID=871652 RepID=A0A1I6CVA5_9RHOB|nr:SDR family oxidoreductase [Poseidonocella sedimentorum]SFQ97043.1 NAD(P)-dependent dehydrogenase, short-chain alcohol dehydrogenase family [Poseidonocella sedimentorum]